MYCSPAHAYARVHPLFRGFTPYFQGSGFPGRMHFATGRPLTCSRLFPLALFSCPVIFVVVPSLSFALSCTLICFYYALFYPWFGSPLGAWLAMCLPVVPFEFSLHSRVALPVRVWGLTPWESVAFSPALPPLYFLFFLGFLGKASACKVFTRWWVAHLTWFLFSSSFGL